MVWLFQIKSNKLVTLLLSYDFSGNKFSQVKFGPVMLLSHRNWTKVGQKNCNPQFKANIIFTRFLLWSHKPSLSSSPPGAAYMRQWIWSALVQIMACHLFGVKPLYERMLSYHQLDSYRNILQWNFNQNTFVIHENAPSSAKWRLFCSGRDELNAPQDTMGTTEVIMCARQHLDVLTIRESVLALEQLSPKRTPQARRYVRAWHVAGAVFPLDFALLIKKYLGVA